MDAIRHFELMSDAAQLAWAGGACWLVAVFATVMERRRARLRNVARLERVGWMPWTTLFVLTAMLGAGLLALSLPVLLKA
ncbi:MAG: hypothetical protein KAF27_10650 [Porphyrobacter sp.]|nr:hypothetical protein [Porphyrobacter sp.]